jgi:hypothetical protein
MRIIIIIITALISLAAVGQDKSIPTDTLRISGQIKNELIFTLHDLDTFPTKTISDVIITNHLGETKKTAKQLKGFLLKKLLEKVDLQTSAPKELNEFYFIFIASDGYKVVFSWNEIFNTATGNSFYLITEQDGKKIKESDERILIVSATDFKTGRRYIKGLQKIIIKRVGIN